MQSFPAPELSGRAREPGQWTAAIESPAELLAAQIALPAWSR